jgi:hypothetical protein
MACKEEVMTEQAGSLLKRTNALLNNSAQSLMEISRATGLSLYWLQKMKAGTVADPSVNSVQILYEHLAQSKLKI